MRKLLALLALLVATEAWSIDINGELKNALLEKRAADPSGSGNVTARVYYNTTSNVMKMFNGTSWLQIADTSTAIVNPMDSAGDLIVGGALGAATKLDSGTANYVLQANGAAAPTWVNGLLMGSGSATTPAYGFSTDTSNNTGLFRPGEDQIGFATSGTNRMTLTTTALDLHLPIWEAGGSVSAPTYSYSGDPDTGVYSGSLGDINFTSNGDVKFSVNDAPSGQTIVDMNATNGALALNTTLSRLRVVSSDNDNTSAVGSEIRTVSDNAAGSSTRIEFYTASSGTNGVRATINSTGIGIGDTTPTSRLSADTGASWNTTAYAVTVDNNDATTTEGNGLLVEGGAASASSNIARFNNSAGTRIFSVGGAGIVSVSSSGQLHNADPGGSGGNTPHECRRKSTTSVADADGIVVATCDAAEFIMGGGCHAGSSTIRSTRPTDDQTWSCIFNTTGIDITAYAVCCDY